MSHLGAAGGLGGLGSTSATAASSNFDSAFAQILNRTQQNLNRINQRYTPYSSNPSSTGLAGTTSIGIGSTGIGASTTGTSGRYGSPGRSRLVAPPPSAFTEVENRSSNAPPPPQPSTLSSDAQFGALANKAAAGRHNANGHGYGHHSNSAVMIEESTLNAILNRLTDLEKTQDMLLLQEKERKIREEKEKDNRNGNELSIAQTALFVEKYIDPIQLELKDLQRQITALTNRLSTSQQMFETLLAEQEQRRSLHYKQDNWIKDIDHWRDEIDRQMILYRKDLFQFIHEKQEIMEKLNLHTGTGSSSSGTGSFITRYDFELLKDKLTIYLQQNLTSSISVWNDSLTDKLKVLERDVVMLKLAQQEAVQKEMLSLVNHSLGGNTGGLGGVGSSTGAVSGGSPSAGTNATHGRRRDGNSDDEFGLDEDSEEYDGLAAQTATGTTAAGGQGQSSQAPPFNLLNAEAVQRILGTAAPSEALVKGFVASEVLKEQNELEDKLTNRMTRFVEHEIIQAKQSLISSIQKQVLAICVDSMLYASAGIGSNSTSNTLSNNNPINIMKLTPDTRMYQVTAALQGSNNHDDNSSHSSNGSYNLHYQQQPISEEDEENNKLRKEFERKVAAGKRLVYIYCNSMSYCVS